MKTFIAINGASGRMGKRLVALAQEDPDLVVVAAVNSPNNPHLGQDAGTIAGVQPLGVPVSAELPLSARIDCVIDFSSPAGTLSVLKPCVDRKLPLVIATTGLEADHRAEIAAAAHHTAVLLSPSMSLVVNLLFKLTKVTAQALAGKGFDVEIIERHHRFKKDAPSGTAAHFAKIVQQEMGQKQIRHGRDGIVGERPHEEIGVHAIRGGDNVGEHTVIFSALGETLELVHKGYSRDSYARGALLAAKFMVGKGAGMYTMNDVLGI
ncbi:4-hydroxy-tetrahydrodipicolinate reductase [Fimbriiglobus ruber]|uniref:4-hydroxy-tetrahydrodipicolinate reductase n=1 Tax=Fimbriiglobus ruber TaxID=1908690 RepID=A0A225D7R9_9BACT|nr:4-hydroxy-tetrahydrodipicolinate reductase [Fimbriiglobus ruber]OWK37650.1 4-hydroxy-tetrahydrodipicolinate reductase [Fimbriiglobus ruber]